MPTHIPDWINEEINEEITHWMPQPEPPVDPIDNTAAAIIKLLEKLDEAVNAITEAADDICQTVTTARKLNEDCINANFDVLTATLRDGIESVKTTIRKGRN